MSDERKIITWEQYLDVTDTMDTSPSPEWDAEVKRVVQQVRRHFDALPDAPKHTDEEYEGLEYRYQKYRETALARIKELEECLNADTTDDETTNEMLHRQIMRQYDRIKELEAKSCDKCEWGRSLGFLPSRAHLKDFTISFDDDEEDKI